jgi:hypothetical protein
MQGDQMSCEKVTQTVAQPIFLIKIKTYITDIVEKSGPKICATLVIFKTLLKANFCPLGKNWPNLVTLLVCKAPTHEKHAYIFLERTRNSILADKNINMYSPRFNKTSCES